MPDPILQQPLLLLILVPLAAALFRRVPLIGPVLGLASWGAVLVALYLVFDQRATLDPWLERAGQRLGLDRQEVAGEETRIRMAPDGHFWVRATIGGVERRMLVDSGATITALAPTTAEAAGLAVREPAVPLILRTANGMIRAQTAEVPELRLGNIVARDLAVVVSPAFGEANVLGMNFLSRLKSWRVEGRTLVLTPNNPQPTS